MRDSVVTRDDRRPEGKSQSHNPSELLLRPRGAQFRPCRAEKLGDDLEKNTNAEFKNFHLLLGEGDFRAFRGEQMVSVSVLFLHGGILHRRTITTPLRRLENARPWLTMHYPNTRFIWGACEASYQ